MSLGLALHGKWDGVSMAAPQMHSYKHERPAYSTPQPVENTPANNECRMVELRGAKVASFILGGDEFICLPQAFDLFLKHLVGGLHTVYTKLKRLSISPVVCNVEQVRVLRGLGAIQPGVNRCKLITRKDFEILYQDCTQASRPGRPPKRYPMLPPTPDLASHYPAMRSMAAAAHGILGAADLNVLHKRMRLEQDVEKPMHQQERRLSDSPQRDGSAISSKDMPNDMNTNATNFYLQAQQAIRQQYQQSAGSGIHNGTIDAQQAMAAAGMNPALAPLMMMSHPALFSGAFPPGMLNHINQIAQNHGNNNAVTSAAAAAAAQIAVNGGNMHQQAAAAYQVAAQASLAAAAVASAASSPRDVDRERSSSLQEEAGVKESGRESPKNILTSNHTGSATNPATVGSGGCGSPHSSLSSPLHGDNRSVKSASIHSDSGNSAKSPSDINGDVAEGAMNGDAKMYENQSHDDDETLNDANRADNEETDTQTTFMAEDVTNGIGNTGNISSMQTLLTNIQGLLKVAADNARLQEKHSSFEIAELKSRMTLERQMRSAAEKKLKNSEDIRALIQSRLKKERKLRKHLQEQLSGVRPPQFGFEKGESAVEKIAPAPTIPITGAFGSNREQTANSPERTSPKRRSPTIHDLPNGDVTRPGVNYSEETFAVSNGEGTPSPPASMVVSTTGNFGSFPGATYVSENTSNNNNNNTKSHFVLTEEAVIMAAKQQFADERKFSKDFDSDSSPRGVHRELSDHVTSYTSVA